MTDPTGAKATVGSLLSVPHHNGGPGPAPSPFTVGFTPSLQGRQGGRNVLTFGKSSGTSTGLTGTIGTSDPGWTLGLFCRLDRPVNSYGVFVGKGTVPNLMAGGGVSLPLCRSTTCTGGPSPFTLPVPGQCRSHRPTLPATEDRCPPSRVPHRVDHWREPWRGFCGTLRA